MATDTFEDQDSTDPAFEQRVRERAYELWEQAGYPGGDADAYWYRALGELAGGASESTEELTDSAAEP